MTRVQELRVDEFSMQKLRESHETIQRLISQLQSMQEQSSRSMLSRDKRLPFDTWNAFVLQENVFGNQCSTFGLHRNPSQGIYY